MYVRTSPNGNGSTHTITYNSLPYRKGTVPHKGRTCGLFVLVYSVVVIEAYRSISVPVKVGEDVLELEVPFTVELVHRLEESIQQTKGATWLRFGKREKSLIEVFDAFIKPYLPEDIDLSKVHPTFSGLFFSHVREELMSSIRELESYTGTTEKPTEPMAGRETTADHQ